MNAVPLMLGALLTVAIAYRYYAAFIATRVLVLDDARPTPAHAQGDGLDYVPTSKWVLFGHHFAAITGAGPLVGPTLALQFGWLPGYLWILIGVVLGGAVHDFVILVGSVRHGGRSLAQVAREEVGPVSGLVAALAIVFILIIAIAAMARVVVTALRDSAWGTFTIAVTIPTALLMGLYAYRLRPGRILQASVFGVVALLAAVVAGKYVAAAPWGSAFLLSERTLILCIAGYGFIASVLPVWLLLCPRDYLSSYLKIGTIALLVVGVLVANPRLEAPAISQFTAGGPIVPGQLFPFVFITIACGAISGIHGLIASGTTPKMLDREGDARMIGYGAMLMEAVVAVVALIAAASLAPGDYFAINTPPDKFAALGMHTEHLGHLSHEIGEELAGRPGGAVSLAVGMARIFAGLPGLSTLISYWYHFAIMFEALFVLTTVDTGTRVARFLVQELGGRAVPALGRTGWLPGTLFTTTLVCLGWGYLVWTGSIQTLWPLLGVVNQLLACVALATATTWLVNQGRTRYVWVTAVPLCFVAVVTEVAGWQLITRHFVPRLIGSGKPALVFQGQLLSALCALAMIALVVVLTEAIVRIARRAPGGPSLAQPEG